MKLSHLAVLAAASVVPAQVILPGNLRAAAGTNFCLRPIQDPPVNGTRVQLAFCPIGTPAQWLPDLDVPRIHPAANTSLCLDSRSGVLQVDLCNTTAITQAFRFNGTSNQVQAPNPVVILPPLPDICVNVGSSVAPCNATDQGQIWKGTSN